MSERAEALAEKFEDANADVIALVESLSDADWQTRTGEGWTVAATAHHVGIVHEGIAGFINRFANSTAAPPKTSSMETVHESNASHAQAYAACSKAEVLDELRAKGAGATAIVRGFSDQQLDYSALAPSGMVQTTEQLIEYVLVGHVNEHLASIKQATGG